MSEKPKLKQVGGIFVDAEIYQQFKKITPLLDYEKPTDLLVETIKSTVQDNLHLLDEDYLSEDELIAELKSSGISKSRSTLNMMRKTGEIPADCYIGGGESNRRIYYKKQKTIEKLQEN